MIIFKRAFLFDAMASRGGEGVGEEERKSARSAGFLPFKIKKFEFLRAPPL
jgi:hypothetical protein